MRIPAACILLPVAVLSNEAHLQEHRALKLRSSSKESQNALLASIQDKLGKHGGASAAARHHAASALLRGRGQLGSDVDTARETLNGMILSAREKLDLEQVKCAEFKALQEEELEQARQDMANLDAQVGQAKTLLLAAEEHMALFENTLPGIKEEAHMKRQQCNVNHAAFKMQLATMNSDHEVMTNMLEGTQCAETSLLQCEHTHTHRSFITFNDNSLRAKVSALKSDFASHALQEGFRQVLQRKVAHRRKRQKHHHYHRQPAGQSRKCIIHSDADCSLMRDQLVQIQSNISDKVGQMERAIVEFANGCKNAKTIVDAEVVNLEQRLKTSESDLAGATEKLVRYQEQARVKSSYLNDLHSRMAANARDCAKNLDTFKGDICSLTRIRSEMYQSAGQTVEMSDCEVTPWAAQECSMTCGGGTQIWTRQVAAHAIGGGTRCPPLEMTRPCNEQQCPVDCELEDWGGWSTCSAPCSSGIRTRIRIATRLPEHGGVPCEETSQTESCNMQACD